MQVGFISQLLWPRYGTFWKNLIAEIGATPQLAALEDPVLALDDPRVQAAPGLAFQLAAAQALALSSADYLVVPDLNSGEETARGSGQDLWIASFPDALRTTFHGLPPIVGVPASLHGDLEALAVRTLHTISDDPVTIRRSWERHRALATAPRYREPRWQRRSGETRTIGVVGQPWLLNDRVVELLSPGPSYHLIGQHQLEPTLLRREGDRVDPKLVGTDREVVGAARYLGRKGGIDEVWVVVDETSGADAALAARLERVLREAPTIKTLQHLADAETLIRALAEH